MCKSSARYFAAYPHRLSLTKSPSIPRAQVSRSDEDQRDVVERAKAARRCLTESQLKDAMGLRRQLPRRMTRQVTTRAFSQSPPRLSLVGFTTYIHISMSRP